MDEREVEEEIGEIRERLIRLEVLLEGVQKSIDKEKATGGTIVIPVAAVVAIAEVARFFIERAA